jgi:hypothetical protein
MRRVLSCGAVQDMWPRTVQARCAAADRGIPGAAPSAARQVLARRKSTSSDDDRSPATVLAKRATISPITIGRWRQGQQPEPSADHSVLRPAAAVRVSGAATRAVLASRPRAQACQGLSTRAGHQVLPGTGVVAERGRFLNGCWANALRPIRPVEQRLALAAPVPVILHGTP